MTRRAVRDVGRLARPLARGCTTGTPKAATGEIQRVVVREVAAVRLGN